MQSEPDDLEWLLRTCEDTVARVQTMIDQMEAGLTLLARHQDSNAHVAPTRPTVHQPTSSAPESEKNIQ